MSIPEEILINILKYLPLSDILNLMLTNKTMKTVIISLNTLWRLKSYHFTQINNKSGQNVVSWYNKCRIFYNWSKGIYKAKVIIQHQTNYMPWLHICNSNKLYLSVGSELQCFKLNRNGFPYGGTVWSFKVPTKRRHDKRTNDISRFVVKDNEIVCGNRDGCVAVYETNEHHITPHLLVHIKNCHEGGNEEVSAVEKVGNTVVTVSNKSSNICFWQLERNSNTCSIYGSSSYVSNKKEYTLPNDICCKSLAANTANDKLALGPSGQDKPMIFDVTKGIIISMTSTLLNCAKEVRDIQWLNEHSVAYVTYCGKVQVFDIRNSEVVYQSRDPLFSCLYSLKTDNDRVIVTGSSEYARCVLYDIRSIYHLQMYFTQKKSSPVYCLHFDSTRLIAAADRGVATLNFNVNKSTIYSRDFSQRFSL